MTEQSRGERTRAEILDAAARLFAVHGYYHTSTNDILAAVSISKGAFYHHFRSKEDLALAVLQRLRQDYEEMLLQPTRAAPAPGRLSELMRRIVQLNSSGQWNSDLLLARFAQENAEKQAQLTEQVTQTLHWLIDACRQFCAEAQQEGALRADLDPLAAAQLIIAALLGAASCQELSEELITLQAVAQNMELLVSPTNTPL